MTNQVEVQIPEKSSRASVREVIETVSHAAQAIAVIIALVAFVVSLVQARDQDRYEKEAAAYKTWEEYFSFQIDNPDLANGKNAYLSDGSLNPKYIWFVERMVLASEKVMVSAPDDIQWQDSIRYEMKSHYRYILSEYFLNSDGPRMSSFCTYGKSLRELIVDTFASEGIAISIAEESGAEGSREYIDARNFVELGLERLKKADLVCRQTLTARGSSDA